ncbi:MAG: hypothetical protein A2086_08240 [Spirochaetes bacterium GWD1_27_9]|nr:MAG: hypothetical protein A2Z98_07545 [Spirochaetes bacterium GWB1_27_13]OHD34508.1 MAG: hypothetical protein A2086_08240 [Spirochaetes bacterium GWD1_27_9]
MQKIYLMLLAFLLTSCWNNTIKVGFSGCLSGKLSDLGVAARNSVIMAVDEINDVGGINGKKIELIIKDDAQDAETAKKVDQELIDQKVVAIIGHVTSEMSLASIDIVNKNKTVLLSSSSTTNQLTGLDDYFIRIISSDKVQSDRMASYSKDVLKANTVSCVYELSNRGFSESWFQNFKKQFENIGGKKTFEHSFTSQDNTSYLEIAQTLCADKSDVILIIAGAIDTAMLSQTIRKIDKNVKIISTGWACTEELIKNGGRAVEGIVMPQAFNTMSQNKKYLEFSEKYIKIYKKEANHSATSAYDAAKYLFETLSQLKDYKKLKDNLIDKKFDGLQGEIFVDKFGDAVRNQYLITIKDGNFVTLE